PCRSMACSRNRFSWMKRATCSSVSTMRNPAPTEASARGNDISTSLFSKCSSASGRRSSRHAPRNTPAPTQERSEMRRWEEASARLKIDDNWTANQVMAKRTSSSTALRESLAGFSSLPTTVPFLPSKKPPGPSVDPNGASSSRGRNPPIRGILNPEE
ncbi:hypothetical protein PMAYCL1PPCAC_24556, partial [Pristionchus mayeri]